jgi:type VI secretion system protein ImpM
MAAGLFGKLPAKRDFVAVNASSGFLAVWEPWLQAGLATSKEALGSGWVEAYNRAPLWRFWLGAGLFGEAVIGAFMPSVDGVGRAFPLAVFCGEDRESLPPPELESNDAWCEAAEAALLAALEPGASFEAVMTGVADLPPPVMRPRALAAPGLQELPDGGVLARDIERKAALAFVASRRFGHRRLSAGQSFWWTIGGEGFAPSALSYVGLPPPRRFVDLITGAFADASVAERAP